MSIDGEQGRDLAALSVPMVGGLEQTDDPWLPFRLVDGSGAVVDAVSVYFRDLQAAGKPETTIRSYGMDLLRWFRFLWAIDVPWQRATRVEARDFSRWMMVAGKPVRPHWRRPTVVPKTGQRPKPYSPSVRAHSETVLRSFYDFHLDAGTGPVVNPFPLDRARRGRRAHAHHNPMEPHRNERKGLYRPSVPSRIPRSIPDEEFNEIFARLPSHRDRALVAFYVSTGATGLGVAVGHPRWCRPGQGCDHGDPQGISGDPGTASVVGCLRLAAALPGRDPRACSSRPPSAAVVDVPNSVAAVDLSCGAPDVRAGRAGGRKHRHVACVAAYRGIIGWPRTPSCR